MNQIRINMNKNLIKSKNKNNKIRNKKIIAKKLKKLTF